MTRRLCATYARRRNYISTLQPDSRVAPRQVSSDDAAENYSPQGLLRAYRRTRILCDTKLNSARSNHAIRQLPLSMVARARRRSSKTSATPEIPRATRSRACPPPRERTSERTNERASASSSHLMQVIPARRASGREGRTGPNGTARPDRREGCSGKTREEGKLQRGPPTADHRPEQPYDHSPTRPFIRTPVQPIDPVIR